MARYFFDVHNNGTVVPDTVGLELFDLKAAVSEAASTLAENAEEMVDGALRQHLAVSIRTAQFTTVLRVTLTLEFLNG